MAAYASVTISRWVTGRCSMARAIHCITNHVVWRRTSDLASQSLFPLSLISASASMMNDSEWCKKSVTPSGWRGLCSCDMHRSSLLVSSELRSKRWNPPIMIKNPCVVDHRQSNNKNNFYWKIFKPEVLNSLLFSLAIWRALKNCLIAQARTYSGTSKAQTNNGRRCSANDRSGFHTHFSIQLFASLVLGHGILGCTATHVHEKIVTRQLQIIFHIVR